jgi:hypothetical protein
MKSIAVVISLVVSTIAISGVYNSARADTRMTTGYTCSSGFNCMSDRYKAATSKAAKAKASKKTQ